jgi:beta-lactamase superfamily II metal-dependent hydrolase
MTVSKASSPSPARPVADEFVVSSFGVKHGDCTLVEYISARVVRFRLLCDAGAVAPPALFAHLTKTPHERGAGFIDVVVLTHVDHDHQGGLPAVFGEPGVEVGEYWGPCLPAFKRLRWLFQKRVFDAIDKAAELEQVVLTNNVPVLYPLEGHVKTTKDRRVTVSVISPAPRLIHELAYGGNTAVRTLVTNSPLPMEWLITGSELEVAVEGQGAPGFNSRTYLGPEDFPGPLADVRLESPDDLQAQAVVGGSALAEPDFFGNHVLNDTSLALVIDVLLDGKRRRRVLLTGDQENWSYIASRYPTGLGVDILKVPHHGGKVFLADKQEENAIEQMYLWLRPRVAVVSAMGQHKLPHVRTRDALRQAGATLFCPNTRGFEPLSSDAVLTDSPCCFDAYGCRQRTTKQSEVVAVRLSGESANAQVPACLQGTLHHGPAPIVVQTQRIVEPDETFVRWTRTEVEKQADWIRERLRERHAEFEQRVRDNPSDAQSLLEGHVGVDWSELETLARAKGHLHLVTDPEPVVRFAVASGRILRTSPKSWSSAKEAAYYIPPIEADVKAVRRWVRSIPHLIFTSPKIDEASIRSGNRFLALKACNMEPLARIAAYMLDMPLDFVIDSVMPQVIVDLASEFDARVCRADEPYGAFRDGVKAILHLYKANPEVPDLFNKEWLDGYWNADSQRRLEFVLKAASGGSFVSVGTDLRGRRDHEAFARFFPTKPEYSYGSCRYPPGWFLGSFAGAEWTPAWQRTTTNTTASS